MIRTPGKSTVNGWIWWIGKVKESGKPVDNVEQVRLLFAQYIKGVKWEDVQ